MSFIYCQSQIEEGDKCKEQCEHCKEYYKPLTKIKTMLLTNEKIEVSFQMLDDNNMTRFNQIGVPVDPHNPNMGLSWKNMIDMQDEDFNKIEEYFLQKQNADKK